MTQDDHNFVRDGRTLAEWLPETIAEDFETRRRAGEALAAIYMGIPSVHAEIADEPRGDPEIRRAAWRRAVRAAVEAADFPRAGFVRALIDRLISVYDDGQRQWREADERIERLLDRIKSKIDGAASEAERDSYRKRLQRAMNDWAGRDVGREESYQLHHMSLTWVLESLDDALLAAPGAIVRLLGHDALAHLAMGAFERIGPRGREQFLERIVDRWMKDSWGDLATVRAIASVGRGDPSLVRRALSWIDEAMRRTDPVPRSSDDRLDNRFHRDFYEADRSWKAAELLYALGPTVLAMPGLGQEVLPALLRLSRSVRPGHRAAAAYGLAGACRDADPVSAAVLERLLELTRDHPWVAGRAIDALGEVRHDAPRVVPRLMELFDEFREFDPDEAYGGRHARVCGALSRFGADAAPAVPRLTRELQDVAADEVWEVHQDVLGALAEIGPAAAEALPVLEEKLRGLVNLERDDEATKVREVIRRIGGRNQSDEWKPPHDAQGAIGVVTDSRPIESSSWREDP